MFAKSNHFQHHSLRKHGSLQVMFVWRTSDKALQKQLQKVRTG